MPNFAEDGATCSVKVNISEAETSYKRIQNNSQVTAINLRVGQYMKRVQSMFRNWCIAVFQVMYGRIVTRGFLDITCCIDSSIKELL